MLLLKVTQLDGKPFPVGIFTACTVTKCITEMTGMHPVDVDVLTDHDMVVQMEPTEMAVSLAQDLHNVHVSPTI